MGFFAREKSIDELYEDSARLEVQQEVRGREADIAEKDAIIKRLKREYGPNWKKILGMKGPLDLATLRTFLTSTKKGLTGAAVMKSSNPMLSPIPGKGTPNPIKFDKGRRPTDYIIDRTKKKEDENEF